MNIKVVQENEAIVTQAFDWVKTANSMWDEQHVSVKLGQPSCIVPQNMSETEALTGWPAEL